MARAMGLDVGTKTVGIALSDPGYLIAQSRETLWRKTLDEDLSYLLKLIEEEDVKEIVIGLPKNMNNTLGPSAQRAKSFGKALEEKLGRPVFYQDERLSTKSAESVLMQTGVRREKRKDYVDALAATFILQSWLDKKKGC